MSANNTALNALLVLNCANYYTVNQEFKKERGNSFQQGLDSCHIQVPGKRMTSEVSTCHPEHEKLIQAKIH